MKFEIGDTVNCNRLDDADYAAWQNCTVIEIYPMYVSPPLYTLTCDAYPGQEGVFFENEIELADLVADVI